MSNKVDRSRRQRLHWVVALALLLGLVGPGAVGAQPATPASGDGATNQVLRDLLRLAPDLAAAGGPASGELASFADVATQLATLGISQPTSPDELSGDYRQATAGLLWPPGTLRSALAPEWSITFGFDLSQIDSALTVGQPPETITIVRGRFDRAALIAAWEQSGYTEVPANQPETTVYSLAEEPEVMFDSLVGRLALASLNNAVILADGTLAFSGSLDRVEAVVERAAGNDPSLADRVDIQALLDAATSDLVSAVLVSGEALRSDPMLGLLDPGADVDTIATAMATAIAEAAQMPPVWLALVGITAGTADPAPAASVTPATGPMAISPARMALTLLLPTPGAAGEAVPVIERRLESGLSVQTQRPYAELFPADGRLVEAVAGRPVVRVELAYGAGVPSQTWIGLLFARDLGFVAW